MWHIIHKPALRPVTLFCCVFQKKVTSQLRFYNATCKQKIRSQTQVPCVWGCCTGSTSVEGITHPKTHLPIAKDMPDVQTPVCLLTICSATTGVAATSTPCASHPSRTHSPHPSTNHPLWRRAIGRANFVSPEFWQPALR